MRHHGDVLLTSPVFSNLQAAVPQAEIHAMVYKDTIPMLEGHPAIQKFVIYDRSWKKKWIKEFSLLREIRREKYDLVINLTEGDRGALVAWFSGAKIRVGFDPEGKGFIGKKKIYTHVVKNCKTPRHTVEKNLDSLRKIGIFPTPEERDLYFYIPPECRQKMEKENYIVLHPVSRWRFKCPPTSLIAELIKKLHERGNQIVLTASSDTNEMKMIEEIIKEIPAVPVINCAGKTSLKELGGIIEGSRLLICVDSVPLHIASATKTPVVALFGPSSDLNWGPWLHPKSRVVAQNFSCRPCFMDGCGGSKMSDCLHTLPVSRIMRVVDELLTGSERSCCGREERV